MHIRGDNRALTFHKRYFIAYITCSHSLGDHVHAPMIGAVERALRRMCSTNHGSCPYDLSSLGHTLLLSFSQNMLLWPLILLYGLGCIKIVTLPPFPPPPSFFPCSTAFVTFAGALLGPHEERYLRANSHKRYLIAYRTCSQALRDRVYAHMTCSV